MPSPSQRPEDKTTKVHLTTSEYHTLLAAEQRRLVIDILKENPTSIGLKELAIKVGTQETQISASGNDNIERIAISLHHIHLPKMADLGVLEYNLESHRIDPSEKVIETLQTTSKFC